MDLKEALLQTVSCMLSSDNEVRRLAEERQKALEVTDDYSLHLTEILLTTEEALDERQMASVLLTKYIKTHWSQEEEDFVEPLVSDTIKRKLRTVLPRGLSDEISKIQTAVASTLSMIAIYDFPNAWTDMVDVITSKLISQVPNEVAGGLYFLNEFVIKSPFEYRTQLLLITPNIYEFLYKICQSESYSAKHRELVISITSELISTEYSLNQCREEATLKALEYFCDLFISILYQPISDKVNYSLKVEIYKFLYNVYMYLPNMLKKTIERLIPATWEILNRCQEAYIPAIIDPDELDFTYENSDFLSLICNSLCNFQTAILQAELGKEFIYKNLPEVLCMFMIFMSVTTELESNWTDEEENFFNDHFDSVFSFQIRSYVKNIYKTLVFTIPENLLIPALEILIAKILEESRMKMLNENENIKYWVRAQESLMLMIETLYEIYSKNNKTLLLNIKPQLSMWTRLLQTDYVRHHQTFFIRIILFGSTLSRYLDREELILHVNVILDSLRMCDNIVKIAGLMALVKHCQEVKRNQRFVQEFSQNLKNITDRVVATTNVTPRLCYAMLQCIYALIEFDKLAVPELLEKIVPLLRNYFCKNMIIPSFYDVYFKIIIQLSKNNLCIGYMQDIMFPEIMKVVMGESAKTVDPEYQSVALRVIKTIIEFAPVPVNQQLIEQCFNCMYRIILTSSECTVISCATYCISYCIAKAPNQVCAINNNEKTGLDFVMDVIKHILDPTMPDTTCVAAGRICVTTLKYLTNVLTPQHFDCIIKSTLTRMNYFKESTNDGLLIIFVYLFHVHTETLMNTLSSIPGPNGDSALVYILQQWIRAHRLFVIKCEFRLSLFALSRVMQFALQHNDTQLFNITIPGKQYKGFYSEPAEVPILAKVLGILLSCVSRYGDHNNDITRPPRNENDDDSSADEHQNHSDDEGHEPRRKFRTAPDPVPDASLDRMVFDDYINFDSVDVYVVDFLRTLAQTPTYHHLSEYLSDNEKMLVRNAGIEVVHQ